MAAPGIVATATAALLDWAGAAGLSARSGPPVAEAGSKSESKSGGKSGGAVADVHLWLVALLGEQDLRPGHGAAPVRFRMRYLVAPGRPDDTATLDRLLAATVTGPCPPVFEEVPAQLWSALGVPARPAFWLDVPGRIDRPVPVAPQVTGPLVVHLHHHAPTGAAVPAAVRREPKED